MLPVKNRGRGRVAATLATSLGLVAAAGAVTTGPAQSVPPTGDCPTAFAVADLVEDQPVEGLTVTRGTTPTEFTGKVIGVLEDGIAPDLDMIMMELDSAEIQRVGGIWQGMSGSPVYDTASGDLIGAVAYGLSWGPSPVAGITPYEKMDDYLAAPSAAQVQVTSADASRIAAGSDVTQSQASEGFSRLRIPKVFSGVSDWRLDRAATHAAPHGKARQYVVKHAGTMSGTTSAATVDASDLVAGGNLGATFAYGDITAGGVGTVTSVCDGRLVGFGHPMMFSGKTSLSLHPASALYVQKESLGAPFKVANIAAPVGTIDQDRTAGISGFLDGLPETMDVTSNLSYLGKTRSGTTHVSVPAAAAEMTFYEQLTNHDAVLESFGPGSEDQNWTITGTDNGAPFSLSFADMYTSDYDIAFESPWDVADAVWALSQMSGVDVDTVEINGEVADDHSTWRLVQVRQRRGGEWVTLTRRKPAIVAAGGTLNLRAVLESGTEERTLPLSMPVPARASRGEGMLMVAGGGSSWNWLGGADTVDQLEENLSNLTRNDQVEGRLFIESRHDSYERQDASDPTGEVVTGRRRAGLVVR
jgi:hypothetical protein